MNSHNFRMISGIVWLLGLVVAFFLHTNMWAYILLVVLIGVSHILIGRIKLSATIQMVAFVILEILIVACLR